MAAHELHEIPFEQRVRDVIARLLRVPPERVAADASLAADLGVDSLLHMTMIVGLEQHFDIELPDQEAARLTNVADVIEVVSAHLAGRCIANDSTTFPGTLR